MVFQYQNRVEIEMGLKSIDVVWMLMEMEVGITEDRKFQFLFGCTKHEL
jgi:hypothetical protein